MSTYALIVALLGGGGGYTGFNAALDVADGRWMTYEQHAANALKSYIRQLKREIRALEHKIEVNTATDWDRWELEKLKEDLEAAQDEQTG